ncbi:hypothetical protein ALTERO38_20080 [Alteromonas sp. 38]|nr:hypothetical protein ALTER154_100458 [Alteromonas sp. 154]VXA96279.1 hypothetical protein ALTERO38_20080 [Alteromonas sp. 38]
MMTSQGRVSRKLLSFNLRETLSYAIAFPYTHINKPFTLNQFQLPKNQVLPIYIIYLTTNQPISPTSSHC